MLNSYKFKELKSGTLTEDDVLKLVEILVKFPEKETEKYYKSKKPEFSAEFKNGIKYDSSDIKELLAKINNEKSQIKDLSIIYIGDIYYFNFSYTNYGSGDLFNVEFRSKDEKEFLYFRQKFIEVFGKIRNPNWTFHAISDSPLSITAVALMSGYLFYTFISGIKNQSFYSLQSIITFVELLFALILIFGPKRYPNLVLAFKYNKFGHDFKSEIKIIGALIILPLILGIILKLL